MSPCHYRPGHRKELEDLAGDDTPRLGGVAEGSTQTQVGGGDLLRQVLIRDRGQKFHIGQAQLLRQPAGRVVTHSGADEAKTDICLRLQFGRRRQDELDTVQGQEGAVMQHQEGFSGGVGLGGKQILITADEQMSHFIGGQIERGHEVILLGCRIQKDQVGAVAAQPVQPEGQPAHRRPGGEAAPVETQGVVVGHECVEKDRPASETADQRGQQVAVETDENQVVVLAAQCPYQAWQQAQAAGRQGAGPAVGDGEDVVTPPKGPQQDIVARVLAVPGRR